MKKDLYRYPLPFSCLPHSRAGITFGMKNLREELEKKRAQLDQIDGRILSLLNDRARLVFELLDWKKNNDLPLKDLKREEALLKRLEDLNPGPLSRHSVREIFLEILKGCVQWGHF